MKTILFLVVCFCSTVCAHCDELNVNVIVREASVNHKFYQALKKSNWKFVGGKIPVKQQVILKFRNKDFESISLDEALSNLNFKQFKRWEKETQK